MNTKRSLLQRVVVVLIFVICSFVLCACDNRQMTINGVAVEPSMYRLMYNNAEYLSKIEQKDLNSEEIHAQAAEAYAKMIAVEELCEKYSVSLGENGESYIDSLLMEYWPAVSEKYKDAGIDKATLRRYLEIASLETELFSALYGAGGEMAVEDREMRAEYEHRFARVSYLYIPLKDLQKAGIPYEEIMEVAESGLDAVQSGIDMNAVLSMMRAIVPDDLREGLFLAEVWIDTEQDNTGTYSPEFRETLARSNYGATGTYQTGLFILIYYVEEDFESEQTFQNEKDNIIRELYYDDFEGYLSKISGGYFVEAAYGDAVLMTN